MDTTIFYDALSPFYHLIYADWEASIARQGRALDEMIRAMRGAPPQAVLDAACGIGTQSLGLARLGYQVTASDLSPKAIDRARREAMRRGLRIDFSVADMRTVAAHHQRSFDVVIACDNAVPHLLSDADILTAFQQFYRCTAPGGLCLISVRDYAKMRLEGTQLIPHGVRRDGDTRYLVFQVWEFDDRRYGVNFYLVADRGGDECETRVMRTYYYAVTIAQLMRLMTQAGFQDVQRIDDRFFQPVIVGMKPFTA
jgi:SAM-dependent methyltransferase